MPGWFSARITSFICSRIFSLGIESPSHTQILLSVPEIDGPFEVRCDNCGKTYVYKRRDLRRYEGEVPKFKTHPLFEP